MPETLEQSRTSTRYPTLMVASRPGFFERQVLKMLQRMTAGHMTLTLPSGEVMSWGDPRAEIQARIHVKDAAFFRRCVLYGDIGFGEAYVAGEWETDDITAVISWMILNIEQHPAMSGSQKIFSPLNFLRAANRLYHLVRPNSKAGSRKNIEEHYDLSNDFFKQFLDPSMTYSSAFFEVGNEDLEVAQRAKLEKLCQKLKLRPSDHVLEIGSGWGGFAAYAAQQYGVKVTTITVSKQQFDFATQKIKALGLEGRVEVRLQDYRDVTGSFDKIVSVEMLEAVGHEYLKPYFRKCQQVLKAQGIMVLQVITCPDSRYDQLRSSVDWIQKHIFPGSLLPSIAAINNAINATGDMSLHMVEDLGAHYVKTLDRWGENFNARREQIRSLGFSEAFMRKWNYYFSYCEAAFAMRNISVQQLVYTRPNNRSL